MEENKEEIKRGSRHIAALTLGIISIISAGFWYISIITGILAIIFGVKSARRLGSKLGKAGMITGIVGISLTVLMYVLMLIFILSELA